jgi:hypothetical protein
LPLLPSVSAYGEQSPCRAPRRAPRRATVARLRVAVYLVLAAVLPGLAGCLSGCSDRSDAANLSGLRPSAQLSVGSGPRAFTPTPLPSGDSLAAPQSDVLLKEKTSGRCIDVAYVNRKPGGDVILYDCVATAPDEKWSVQKVGTPGDIRIFDGTLCLAVKDMPGNGERRLTTAACDGTAAQRWTVTSAGQLQHAATEKCVVPLNDGRENQTPLVLQTCDGASSQRWSAETASSVAATAGEPIAPATPEATTSAPAAPSTVPLIVQRFDGRNGSALVSNGIPLLKGALMPGQEPQVHLVVAGTELPVYVASLASRYPDGSVRALLVQTKVPNLLGALALPGTLRIGGERDPAMTLDAPIATPGSAAAQGSAPAGLPQAAALPSAVSYLLQTDLIGATIGSAAASSLGGAFAKYESDFATFANQHWTNVGAAWNDGNYYDRALVYTAAWVRTANPVYWARAAQQAVTYRDGYVVPGNYAPSPHWSLLEGLEKHYLLTGDEASRVAVLRVAEYLTMLLPEYYGPISGDAREMSRFLQASLLAWRLTPSGVTRPAGTSARDWSAHLDWLLGKVYAWQTSDGRYPSDGICKGQLNYMVGMLNTSLIKVYEQYRADAQIQDAVKRAADYLMNTQWRPEANAFNYANVVCATGSPDPAADLGGFFADAYGFLYQRTGQLNYRLFGDQVFAGGVAGAYLTGSKQFNQEYVNSYRYLGYRLAR